MIGWPFEGAPRRASDLGTLEQIEAASEHAAALRRLAAGDSVALAIEAEAGRMVGAARGELERAAGEACKVEPFPPSRNLCEDSPFG